MSPLTTTDLHFSCSFVLSLRHGLPLAECRHTELRALSENGAFKFSFLEAYDIQTTYGVVTCLFISCSAVSICASDICINICALIFCCKCEVSFTFGERGAKFTNYFSITKHNSMHFSSQNEGGDMHANLLLGGHPYF